MEILRNGSKLYGEKPDGLQTLLEVLGRETLDPSFEGDFLWVSDDGTTHACGNFLALSHGFYIRGTAEELAELAAAIHANQETDAYKDARARLRSSKATEGTD